MRVALPQLVGFASVALLRFRQSRVKLPKLSRRQGLALGSFFTASMISATVLVEGMILSALLNLSP